VQGKLRQKQISFLVESRCAHSDRRLRIELDSDLNLLGVTAGAEPYIFVPSVDFKRLAEASIIDIF
jgi:hypothetical protein